MFKCNKNIKYTKNIYKNIIKNYTKIQQKC